jgi:hypothetical protein
VRGAKQKESLEDAAGKSSLGKFFCNTLSVQHVACSWTALDLQACILRPVCACDQAALDLFEA